jgi:hypothetical protein
VNGIVLFAQTLIDPTIEEQMRANRARTGSGFVYGQGFSSGNGYGGGGSGGGRGAPIRPMGRFPSGKLFFVLHVCCRVITELFLKFNLCISTTSCCWWVISVSELSSSNFDVLQ